jgi:hypothetical protein
MEKVFTGNIYKQKKLPVTRQFSCFCLIKIYGRAPTFLLATGYEQVRSVVAYLTGDIEGAKEVHLELPETGVCSVNLASSCCDSDIQCN